MSGGPSRSIRAGHLGDRRRAFWMANANALLWAIGNGLVSTTLVIYLALELGAAGIAVSLILASRRFVGLLRLGVPALVARWGHRKATCMFGYLTSALVLVMVPLAALPELRTRPRWGIAALVTAWCVYHVLEYIAGVALWSWLGDVMPRPIRGRMIGARESWKLVGRIVGMTSSAGFAGMWVGLIPSAPRWTPLALSATAGAAFMALAVIPLAAMPAFAKTSNARPRAPWRTLGRALAHRPYRRLLTFHVCFSLVNGVTATAQNIYPRNVLGVPYEMILALRSMMRGGQTVVAQRVGGLTDRWGNRPVMIVAQLIVATGPLFFLAARPQTWWLVGGAYVVWIAYAGLNIGLDNSMLKFADERNNAPYVAVYHSVTDLANGVATIAGGFLFDLLRGEDRDVLPIYAALFVAGWIGRTAVVVLLARLIEPGALRLLDIVGRRAEAP